MLVWVFFKRPYKRVKWIVYRNCIGCTFLYAWELSRGAEEGKVSFNVLPLLSEGFI